MNNIFSILLIKDDIDACYDLQNCFENTEQLEVADTTYNAHQSLEMVPTFLPGIILLDLELYTESGNSLLFLQKVRRISPPFPSYILISTTNTSQITLYLAHRLDADFIHTKYENEYSTQYVPEFEKPKPNLSHTLARKSSVSIEHVMQNGAVTLND